MEEQKVSYFETSSGSSYNILKDDEGVLWLVRENSEVDGELRRDGQKIKVKKIVQLELGRGAVIVLEPLGLGDMTVRNTSTVVKLNHF